MNYGFGRGQESRPREPGPPELAALFAEMKSASEANDIRILWEAGLLPQGSLKGLDGGDLYSGRLGDTEQCLAIQDLDVHIGAKGLLLTDEPAHLRDCDACRDSFALYRRIREIDFRRLAEQK